MFLGHPTPSTVDHSLANSAKRIVTGGAVQNGQLAVDPGHAITTDELTPAAHAHPNGSGPQPIYQPSAVSELPQTQTENAMGTSPSSTRSLQQASSPAQQRPTSSQARRHPPGRPPPLPPYPQAYTSSGRPGRPGMMVGSPTGGMQVTLDGAGSWSDLARQDATLPADAAGVNNELPGKEGGAGGGVFGFLSRKKGRAHSPKPKERGVLGKEGARVVIG